ncbi:hypothetical protein [Methylobacterium longum]|uniref:Uncharacterized protein n=1 Tax=Methylobacterium longum TaxID=767694 RepID=A0ABT8APB5_9HYPH|nr:hypothetical protein [Methylobacterium longum]MDN3571450.1 hypothetical protein [Methylobacterium longum]GJE12572.1 hypothetical protein FOHLNKBM_3622 [Methylobacterium longum]
MHTLFWLISRVVQFFVGGGAQRRSRFIAEYKEAEVYDNATATSPRNFDADYRAATMLLKARMDKAFPDNYHARLSDGANSARDFGDERAEAIDTASAAIAAALRNGATVKQAANAGAASVGI